MRYPAGVLLVALTLSACSGAATVVSPTAAPNTPSKQTQRFEAQAAIAVSGGIETASAIAIVVGDVESLLGGNWTTYPHCKNGIETSLTPVNPETFLINVDVFYDPKCTKKFVHSVTKAVLFLPGNLTLTGKATTYNPAGKAVAFANFTNKTTLAVDSAHGVTQGGIALSPTGRDVLQFGLTCEFAVGNACSFGAVAVAGTLGQSLGVSALLSNFVASGSTSDGAVTMRAYQAALGKLHLHQTSAGWAIGGGSLVASLSGSFSENVNPKTFDIAGSLALTDAKQALTTANSFGTRTGIGAGSVKATSSGMPFTTFFTDAAGSGTIAYSDGSSADIVLFIITS